MTSETQQNPANADAPEESEPQAKSGLLKYVIIIGAIAIAVGGFFYYKHASKFESTDNASIDAHIVQVSPKISGHVERLLVRDNQLVKRGDLLVQIDPRDYQTKVNEARASVAVAEANVRSARVNAEMTSITSIATAGQASAGVNAAESQTSSSVAQLAATRGGVEEADAQIRSARANAEQARAKMMAAEADAQRLASDAARTQKLFQTGFASREEMEHAQSAAKSGSAQLAAARETLQAAEAATSQALTARTTALQRVAQLQAQLGSSEAQLAQSQAHLQEMNVAAQKIAASNAEYEMAKAQLDESIAKFREAELNLSYTQITAPDDGFITRRTVEEGNYVQVGQLLMAIVPDQPWVVANFKETQLSKIRVGQRVDIRIDALKHRDFTGHVDSIQRGTGSRFSLLPPENATGNFVKVVQRVPVKIVFDDNISSDVVLAPGMSVEPRVHVK